MIKNLSSFILAEIYLRAMKVTNLAEGKSVLHYFISELRNKDVQGDPLRFRQNLQRIGEVMSLELSKELTYADATVETPLGVSTYPQIQDNIVVASILRAGLPLHNGFLSYFDRAENAFVSAYRKYVTKTDFDIHVEYISSPSLEGKTLILVDPMLASGLSMELAYKALLEKGTPAEVHMCSVIGSQQGVDYIQKAIPGDNVHLWMCAIDPELNDKSYIIPGLGDAGDLAYGEKMDNK